MSGAYGAATRDRRVHVGRAAVAVRASLMGAISDQYRPGDRLPSEPELAAAYS